MADGFQRIIQELRKHEPRLLAGQSAEWGAEQSSYRQKIRAGAEARLKEAGENDVAAIKNLNAHPRPANWSLSISHTKGLGAWIASPRPVHAGLDIEVGDRISQAVIARVCGNQEIKSAPQPEFLWCAKEAYFKALENHQPPTIAQLEISRWKKLGENLYSFQGSKALHGEGFVLLSPPYIFGACLVRLAANHGVPY